MKGFVSWLHIWHLVIRVIFSYSLILNTVKFPDSLSPCAYDPISPQCRSDCLVSEYCQLKHTWKKRSRKETTLPHGRTDFILFQMTVDIFKLRQGKLRGLDLKRRNQSSCCPRERGILKYWSGTAEDIIFLCSQHRIIGSEKRKTIREGAGVRNKKTF